MSDWKKTCEFADKVRALSQYQLNKIHNGEELTEEDHAAFDELLKESEEMIKESEEETK